MKNRRSVRVAKNRVFFVLAFTIAFSSVLVGCGDTSSNAPSAKENTISESAVEASNQIPSQEASSESSSAPSPARQENVGAKISEDGTFRTFPVYTDGSSPDNHFVASGWMGDFNDIKINEKYLTNPRSGSTSIEVAYSNKATQGARWAGVYWQNPPNNWGTRPGGYDLTGARKVTFWARGEKGGERIEEFKIGGITGEYADSDVAGIGPVVLTTEWQQFTIDLEGKDLSSISGGFCWATNLDVNPDGATFYLDDIRYE